MTSEARPEANSHEPVLLPEILDFLLHASPPPGGGVYCDVTVGLGGHARGILERSGPDGRLIGLDRDSSALDLAASALSGFGDRMTLLHAPFSDLVRVLKDQGQDEVDGILADLGVSSPQLDQGERGFSFQRRGPLDMRMDQSTGETAEALLGRISEPDLAALLRDYGEERFAGRIARRIVEARDRGALDSTSALAAVVARAVPGGDRRRNPATRTFQALRIAVNQELRELEALLEQAPGRLRPSGRLCVIAFHSLEDRMVKRRFLALSGDRVPSERAGARYRVITKRPVVASDAEQACNPRSRSAKLRVLERIA
jgi:16S rRNA (cytosine1402-N4)-methyltransferase